MADYSLQAGGMVLRNVDKAWIPPDPLNADYQEYLVWEEVPGNDADPYIEPPPPPVVLTADQRLDAGVAAAVTMAQAALTAIEDIPTSGPVATRLAMLQLHTGALAAAFVAFVEALDATPEE